jgi:hypothetical protein
MISTAEIKMRKGPIIITVAGHAVNQIEALRKFEMNLLLEDQSSSKMDILTHFIGYRKENMQ